MPRRILGADSKFCRAAAVIIRCLSLIPRSELERKDRQRFWRIERDLELIKALLIKHEETLQKLPDAIKEKLGFKQ